MLEQEPTEQKNKSKEHIAFAAFISTFFFLMGPMTETIIVVLGDNPHVPFYVYTMTLWLASTSLTFNIAVNWEKRTQSKNYQWVLGGVVAFILMYLTATVF